MTAYYSENDPYAAAWLRNLIAAGHITDGVVDERSIEDVQPSDLAGFDRVHFFAGIGVWDYALRLAGWPAGRPVWTGSCPCQPFSAAGKGHGTNDERHLWPAWLRLIQACRPALVFGEQVASAAVVGRAGKGLQEVRDREAVLGVLRELEREPPLVLQDVRAGRRAWTQAQRPGAHGGASKSMAGHQPWFGAGESGEVSGEGPWPAVRPGPAGHSAPHRDWLVRADGASLRPVGAEGMECAFAGSGDAGRGIHAGEHESRALFGERDGEHLGAEPDFGDCAGDQGAAAREVERLFGADWRMPAGEPEGAWIDVVHADLERAGYTLGAAVLPACGLGAPHIRQRLWFVAHASSGGHQHGPLRSGSGREEVSRHPLPELAADGTAGTLAHAEQRGSRCEAAPADHVGTQADGPADRAGGCGCASVRLADTELHDGAGRIAGPHGRAPLEPHRHGASGLVADDHTCGRGSVPVTILHDDEYHAQPCGGARGLAEPTIEGSQGGVPAGQRLDAQRETAQRGGETGPLGNPYGGQQHEPEGQDRATYIRAIEGRAELGAGGLGATGGFWSDAEWIACRDGKARPVEPGSFPLATRHPSGVGLLRAGQEPDAPVPREDQGSRIGRLRCYGNAIVPAVAAAFVRAAMWE